MIDGLKLTMPGDVLKARVARRIRQHESAVERYREDMKMDPKDQTDDHPWLPDHLLESMIDERLDRIAALTLIRDHVVSAETYLLDKSDLQFAEMLPPPPEPEWPICMARQWARPARHEGDHPDPFEGAAARRVLERTEW